MQWYEILKHIKTRIEQSSAAESVLLGAVRPQMLELTPESPGKVLLIRGNERADYEAGLCEQKVATVYLECWIRDDEKSLNSGYRRLANFEDKIDAVLQQIKNESGLITPNVQIMDLEIKSKSGDLDTMRPLIGSQYEIAVTVFDGT